MGKHEAVPPRKSGPKKIKSKKKGGKSRAMLALYMIIGTILISFSVLLIMIFRTPDQVAPPTPPSVTDPDDPTADDDTPDEDDTEPEEPQPEPKVRKEDYYTFVLAGTNDDWNTDVLMVGGADIDNKSVSMISIPRDTQIDTDSKNMRINAVYGMDGPEELVAEMTRFTGVAIDYYCVINIESFTEIVDIIGGVDFYVPYDMYHPDAQEEYTIDLKEGWQTLDADEALQLVRYRGTRSSDFGRIELQKDFMVACLQKVLNNFSVSTVLDMIDVIADSVETNMPANEMAWFYINLVSELDLETGISMNTMPATTADYNGVNYVFPIVDEMIAMFNEKLNPYTTPLTIDDMVISLKMDEEQ